jgi:hypothetical protein
MIGRGSRILSDKKEFTVIDLGNNQSRFGLWQDEVDWMSIFRNPDLYLQSIRSDEEIEVAYKYVMPEELRAKFSKSTNIDFDVKKEHLEAIAQHHRPKVVIDKSIDQHLHMCFDNSETQEEALALADLLTEEINYRMRVYARCLSKSSEGYVKWRQDDYKRNLRSAIFMKYIQSGRNELGGSREVGEISEEGDE